MTKMLPVPPVYFELAPHYDEPPKNLPVVCLVHQPRTGKFWRKINGEWHLIGGEIQ